MNERCTVSHAGTKSHLKSVQFINVGAWIWNDPVTLCLQLKLIIFWLLQTLTEIPVNSLILYLVHTHTILCRL